MAPLPSVSKRKEKYWKNAQKHLLTEHFEKLLVLLRGVDCVWIWVHCKYCKSLAHLQFALCVNLQECWGIDYLYPFPLPLHLLQHLLLLTGCRLRSRTVPTQVAAPAVVPPLEGAAHAGGCGPAPAAHGRSRK